MLLPRLSLMLIIASSCKCERPVSDLTQEQRWRAQQRDALARTMPPNVSAELSTDGRMLEGKAATFDDVSEFMRGLNNIVWSQQGYARVVERRRDGGFHVELLDGGEILEVGGEAAFLFSDFELTSTETVDGGVAFTLKFGATK